MALEKSLDEVNIIAALLHDIHYRHGSTFNTRALKLTTQVVRRRVSTEGLGFLTKSLPKLGKAFDRALCEQHLKNVSSLRFKTQQGSELPSFLGEFFNRVFDKSGRLLQDPCKESITVIRHVCFVLYKYELPYTDEQERQVTLRFEKTEEDLSTLVPRLALLREAVDKCNPCVSRAYKGPTTQLEIVREARAALQNLFALFDPTDISPRHGPGAVATKQRLADKYHWTNISSNITTMYPADAYYYASAGHICDRLQEFSSVTDEDLPARVILVPKDSRGPRLISCEPVDYQWIQQGLGKAIVELVEQHPLTRDNVRFTDQMPNRMAALLGSRDGRYATLDLNEASDRISTELVRLLFPDWLTPYLEACRSSSTELPDGRILKLTKFAPMGSSLCFPILALSVWAILYATAPDAHARERVYVYGDDVIVPTAQAANAIEQLESFGLKVNRDKSCTSGLFRESCGMDAFSGVDVTPVRIRTVWSESPSPETYTSWIAYANSFYDKGYWNVYQLITDNLFRLYGEIPSEDMGLTCPSLRYVPAAYAPRRKRYHPEIQSLQWYVRDIKAPVEIIETDGWEMLLRYFAEGDSSPESSDDWVMLRDGVAFEPRRAYAVRVYTKRKTSMLVKRWR